MTAGSPAFGETYLCQPDLFPARRAGEPWGDRSLFLDFVGGPYAFHGLSDAQALEVEDRFGPMLVDTAHDPLDIRIFRVAPNEFRRFDLQGWSYTFDRRYLPNAVEIAGLEFMARLDLTPTLVGALWTPLGEGEFFRAQLENFFRVLVAYRLLQLGGVLFHSAGVVSRDLAYLFLGCSGAGKSTISRISLAAGREVLSDDMNALCPAQNTAHHQDDTAPPMLEKLPFAGDLGQQPGPRRSFPLAGMCRLIQGEHALQSVSTPEAVAFLVGCAPFVNVDPHRVDQLTDNLLGLLRTFPLRQLTFAKDPGFWPLLEGPPAGDGS